MACHWIVFRYRRELSASYSPHRKKGEPSQSEPVPEQQPSKAVPDEELLTRIEKLVLEESTHIPSKSASANGHDSSKESLPTSDPDSASEAFARC